MKTTKSTCIIQNAKTKTPTKNEHNETRIIKQAPKQQQQQNKHQHQNSKTGHKLNTNTKTANHHIELKHTANQAPKQTIQMIKNTNTKSKGTSKQDVKQINTKTTRKQRNIQV